MEISINKSSSKQLISESISNYKPFQNLLNAIEDNEIDGIPVCGLSGSSVSFILETLTQNSDKIILVVASNAEEAHDLYDDLSILLGEKHVGHYPARQILPYDFKSPIGEIIGQRISTLSDILENKINVIICPVRALIEPTISYAEMANARLSLEQGKEYELDIIIKQLVRLGFKRVPVVEEVGDFAVRGGLIDFFTPGSEAPVRVEFFGDEVETIRHFEVATQRTINRIKKIKILPKREIPITQETLEKFLEHLPEDDSDYIRNRYLNDPELPGLEWLSVLFDLPQGSLLDFIETKGILFLQGEGTLRAEIDAIYKEAEGLYQRLNKHFINLPTPDRYYHATDKIFNNLSGWFKIDNLPFRGGKKDIIDFKFKPHPALGSRLDLLGKTIQEFNAESIRYLITTDTVGQVSRLGELITEKSNLDFDPPIEVMNLKGGFVGHEAKIAILTDHEIFSRYHRRVRKKKFKEGVAISDYSNLTQGDFVVHTDYGIARFLGLETLKVDNRNRDCLHLKYANGDKLYVPIEEFNRVSKYSGKDADPSLTALGGAGWEKLKKKTKKAVSLMAEDLLKLYAERKAAVGYAFGEDTVWLKQLEASFLFDETRDQMKAIIDVKRDMRLEQPMDRLVCGDVGFGKTEVAIRAAFKALEEDKQVALLVPTTILAQQHYQTFTERFEEFPTNVGLLSRFRTRKEQLKTLDELAVGKVDMVIGTHRILSKDVVFKDLGLLIIDEEHRFGVRHKEKLRSLKSNVDTLSLTATPIPRTLHMSLMGVRDMSIISSSPKDRLPIITEIEDFDPVIIATAILREIDRGGQVFFVHNRVQTIDAMYNYLKKLVPQVEIAVAHGQMYERSLEGIMLGFLNKRFDVLLCTSIIESGLDIPSANTIIINRADRFGLAQLYQIRGRVGRSSQRAYAYLLTPPIRLMKADAVKRMRAIEAHSDLGAGFALAMRDLEIRGSGTILGTRQSGYIEELGFDLYNRMLDEAIHKLQGQEVEKPPETKLEIDIETHLSNEYINIRQQKVDIYRRLADARKLEEIEQLRDEVIDRFGNLPDSGENLFNGAAVRISASVLEIEKVSIKKKIVNIFFKKGRSLKRSEVEKLHQMTDCPMEFSILERTQIILDMKALENLQILKDLRGILGKI